MSVVEGSGGNTGRAGGHPPAAAPPRATHLRRRVLLPALLALAGCGTTRCTDTARSATEQLLLSNSVDEAVSRLDFTPLARRGVFLDAQFLDGVVDRGYLVASLRQQLLASGCLLQEDRAKATYVVEARAGAVGTDRSDLLFGIPQLNVPSVVPGQPGGMIPEIPLAKKTDRKGVAKLAVVVFNRTTGEAVWESGLAQAMSTAKDTWVLGAGPYQHGTLANGSEFAGQPVQVPLKENGGAEKPEAPPRVRPVTQASAWRALDASPNSDEVIRATAGPGATAPPAAPPAGKPPAQSP